MRWLFGIVCSLAVVLAARLEAATVVFTHEGDSPGAARFEISEESLSDVESVPLGEGVSEVFKLACSAQQEVIGIAGEVEGEPCLFMVSRKAEEPVERVKLPAEVSHVIAAPGGFLLALSKGYLVFVDAETFRISGEINTRKSITPPARKGEDICLLSEGQALVSFQKDDDDSPALGNRLMLLGLSPFQVDADLPIPRERPELHIEGARKEQGPGPELLIPIPAVNTLAITLDLYGAVAFTDLDAIRRGELRNFSMVPTSGDQQWGTAFPDRAALVETKAGPRLIICNAGAGAGIAVFDPATRQKTHHFATSAGCDPPVILPTGPMAATVISGKTKVRKTGKGVEKSSHPGRELLVMDFSDPVEPQLSAFDMEIPTLLIAAGGEKQVVVFSNAEVLLVNPVSGKILDRKKTPGPPVRAISLP